MRKEENIVQFSSFSGRIVFPVFYSLMATLLIPATLWYILTSTDIYDMAGGIIFFVLLAVIWIVFVWGELRLKAIRIVFMKNAIETVSFLGLGRKLSFNNNGITGYKLMLEPAWPLPNECIILFSNEKEVLRISQFYFRNYELMKARITGAYKDLGREKFSTIKALTAIFKN